jgi:hypothetical protein
MGAWRYIATHSLSQHNMTFLLTSTGLQFYHVLLKFERVGLRIALLCVELTWNDPDVASLMRWEGFPVSNLMGGWVSPRNGPLSIVGHILVAVQHINTEIGSSNLSYYSNIYGVLFSLTQR